MYLLQGIRQVRNVWSFKMGNTHCSISLFTFRACRRATAQLKVPGTGRISSSSFTAPFVLHEIFILTYHSKSIWLNVLSHCRQLSAISAECYWDYSINTVNGSFTDESVARLSPFTQPVVLLCGDNNFPSFSTRRSITTQRTYHTTEQTNDKAITINYSVCVRLHESWYCGNNHNGGYRKLSHPKWFLATLW
jgi:hypothetical protein